MGTEHLLLGLVRDGVSAAAQVLVELEADLDHVKPPGPEGPAGPCRRTRRRR
ncbi:Clp protease N-terminal domain-containing protein [Nonomuraea wenchangensis]